MTGHLPRKSYDSGASKCGSLLTNLTSVRRAPASDSIVLKAIHVNPDFTRRQFFKATGALVVAFGLPVDQCADAPALRTSRVPLGRTNSIPGWRFDKTEWLP